MAMLRRFCALVLLLCATSLMTVAWPGLSTASGCFGNDVGAGSVQRSDHLGWASAQDPATLAGNLAGKVDALIACATDDNALREIFADLSVVVASHVSDPACFGGDAGVTIKDRQAHLAWAQGQSRQTLVDNLRWKSAAAMACLDRGRQNEYFADASVTIAASAAGLGAQPPAQPQPPVVQPPLAAGQVGWQLGQIRFENAVNYQNVALRVDDLQGDANGGLMRITALNDGECVPGAGQPASGIEHRFLFRWQFDRDVSRLTFPDKVTVRFSIEADAGLACFDLNPIMHIAVDEAVLNSTLRGERFYWQGEKTNFHVGGPRVVEVIIPESGAEGGGAPHKPVFKIVVWGFRGNRGMQMEAIYPYTLIAP